jgi:hypothetical protein
MDKELLNYIKYCLGYVRITREKTAVAQQKYSISLPTEYFNLTGLLNGDTDGNLGELINLETFYKYDPKKVPKEEQEKYEQEKVFANKIEDIYNKYQNDQFTKQTIVNFGYFEIELPIEENGILDIEEDEEEIKEAKTKIDRYPLFSLPIKIEKEITKSGVGKYHVYSVDPEIQVNIGVLESILGEDLYFQLLDEMGKYEIDGKFILPITDLEIFKEVSSSDLEGMIFTYVWYFDDKTDWVYIENLIKIFREKESEIYFVELEASIETRISRNKTEHRLNHKPSKRGESGSDDKLRESILKHRPNSLEGEIKEKNYLRIDNTNLDSVVVAKKIKEKFNL